DFAALRQRVRQALSTGNSVVVDSTNLRRSDRLANVALVPADIPIEYVVIDRPMEEKRRDGGWRLEREGLLEGHAAIMLAELADILAGDGIPNVTVIDRRT